MFDPPREGATSPAPDVGERHELPGETGTVKASSGKHDERHAGEERGIKRQHALRRSSCRPYPSANRLALSAPRSTTTERRRRAHRAEMGPQPGHADRQGELQGRRRAEKMRQSRRRAKSPQQSCSRRRRDAQPRPTRPIITANTARPSSTAAQTSDDRQRHERRPLISCMPRPPPWLGASSEMSSMPSASSAAT